MRIDIDSPLWIGKQTIIVAVKDLVAAEWYAEAHPEDAHGADSVELADDQLDEMLLEFARKAADA